MATDTPSPLSTAVAAAAQPLTGAPIDYDALLDLIGDARFVLLGEATHGTHEFYRERARITTRLIGEKGFTAVAVEGDWPDAYRVNRYVRGCGEDADATAALAGFSRFPNWMWRNADVVDFVAWLRTYNDALAPAAPRIGFYGLDLYSLFTSIAEVLRYLDQVAPDAARRARERYACFDHFLQDSQRYAYEAGFGLSSSCEDDCVNQLRELRARAGDYARRDGDGAGGGDAYFYAQQNARLVVNAEQYYRTMFRGQISSWNLRDRHMTETLVALERHLAQRHGAPARIVVWEHNSHVGDACATEVGQRGEWNVGQLTRELYGDAARLIGFTTYQGSVTAASDWDGPAERKQVSPALPGSYEEAFHHTGLARFMLPLRDKNRATEALLARRLERAIGVIYLPQSERRSHYFYARLPEQFDAVLHIDDTRAVVPLEPTSQWHAGEAPHTFPVGV